MSRDKVGYVAHKVALETFFGRMFLVCCQSFFFNKGLATGAFFPARLWTFVATNVEIFAREDVHHLRKHIFGKLQGAFVACT